MTCWSSAKPMSSASGSVAIRRSASGSPVNGRWSGGTGRLMGGSTPRPATIDGTRRRADYHRPMTTPAPFADAVGTLAVRCGRLLDVVTGETLPDRLLLVRDGRVEAVLGPDDGLPDGTLGRSTSVGSPSCPGSSTPTATSWARSRRRASRARRPRAPRTRSSRCRNARVTLEAGFTTVRDLGTFRAFVDVALRDAIDAGELEGPRMQCAGAFITVPWGGGDVVGLAHDIALPEDLRFGVVTTPDEVRERVRRLIIGGAGVIKLIGTGAVLTRGGVPGAPELSEAEMRAAVDEATHYDRFVAVHAHSSLGARWAIRPGPAPWSTAR